MPAKHAAERANHFGQHVIPGLIRHKSELTESSHNSER